MDHLCGIGSWGPGWWRHRPDSSQPCSDRIRRHLQSFVADIPRRFGVTVVGWAKRAACGMGPSPRAARRETNPAGALVLDRGGHDREA